ncbi:hypothetical protein F4804DRAFT_330294 [Jackrogersella minutella]|nr:hypothetical protein F4804DRAFT_330294 [Jackrogersella minutella]
MGTSPVRFIFGLRSDGRTGGPERLRTFVLRHPIAAILWYIGAAFLTYEAYKFSRTCVVLSAPTGISSFSLPHKRWHQRCMGSDHRGFSQQLVSVPRRRKKLHEDFQCCVLLPLGHLLPAELAAAAGMK